MEKSLYLEYTQRFFPQLVISIIERLNEKRAGTPHCAARPDHGNAVAQRHVESSRLHHLTAVIGKFGTS